VSLRLALAQYPVGAPKDWACYARCLRAWAAQAAASGAELLVWPEYAAMELAAMFPPTVQQDLALQLSALQTLLPDYLALHAAIAQEHRLHLLSGSFPTQTAEGSFVNRCHFFAPSGRYATQDKQIMTRFEREQWRVSRGDGLRVFDTALGCIGINICYDIEFPLLARAQVAAGALLILAPSCTDTSAGYWRVRLGAQARALENQCFVAQCPLVGEAAWSAAVDVNVGRAGVFTPPDHGLPDDGVLALGDWCQPQWLHTALGLATLAEVRQQGQVLNHRNWQEQGVSDLPPVERIHLY
jgi:predicted amidohydrolase